MRERKKMRGNDIQECDEYDKRNAVESPRARARARAQARDSRLRMLQKWYYYIIFRS